MVRVGFALVLFALAGCGRRPASASTEPAAGAGPVLGRTFPLTGVGGPADKTGIAGRIDHMAYDPATGRLFVACVANGSLEVIDLDAGERAGTVPGLPGPQGVAVTGGWVYVATGDDGRLHRFYTRTLAERDSARAGEDADNVRIGPDGAVWVSSGGGGPGRLTPFDPKALEPGRAVRLARMPEGFQLDPAGGRVFANLPAGKRSAADGSVVALKIPGGESLWERRLQGRAGNFPMALDAAHGRLFVATRRPPRLVVLDARDGSVLGEAECSPESDDLFFDAASGRVAVIGGGTLPATGDPGGAGASLDLFAVDAAGRPSHLGGAPLPPHARTGALAANRRAIYVGVPASVGRPAEVREYDIGRSADESGP